MIECKRSYTIGCANYLSFGTDFCLYNGRIMKLKKSEPLSGDTHAVLYDENDMIVLTVWTQYSWNEYRELSLDDLNYYTEDTCLFNMPIAGTAIFELYDDYHVVIAHDKLDNIDLMVAVGMLNALGGHGVKYELEADSG